MILFDDDEELTEEEKRRKKKTQRQDSLVIAAITGSAMLGMALGGDPVGAIVGDMLNGSLDD